MIIKAAVKTHHEEIERLFADGLVKKIFVHESFFNLHPNRRGHPDFTSTDQTSKYWYHQRGKLNGLKPLYDRPAFIMSNASKVTTGAHSVRYAANLGYTKIALLGIDLKYVEIIPEAEKTQGVGLIIKTTPKTNPNYFFDGYQKAGDLFNIPNPDEHNGRLHIDSFRMIPRDFSENSVDCQIINCNQQSTLSNEDIFPYRPINEILGETLLGCIFVPTNSREIDLIIENFKLWAIPDFSPITERNISSKPDLVLVFNNSSAKPHEEKIRQSYDKHSMSRYFGSLNFEYLNLEGEADVYIRDYTQPVGEMGFKAGPNNQFFQSLRRVEKYGRYAFLMETDCIPIRRGWLTKIQNLTDNSEPFWIMGNPYRGLEKIDHVRHLNGNSIYAVGDAGFQRFVSEFWEHHTWRLVRTKNNRLAYDCIIEIMFSEPNIRDDGILAEWRRCAHMFRNTGFIYNLSGKKDITDTDEHLIKRIRSSSPETYILHNRTARQIEIERHANTTPNVPRANSRDLFYPRLLVFDAMATDEFNAATSLNFELLKNWPSDHFLQIAEHNSHGLIGVRIGHAEESRSPLDIDGARKVISDFTPEIILYRPTANSNILHALAMEEITARGIPLVTWFLEDWPSHMQIKDSAGWNRIRPNLEYLLNASALRLSSSEAMSEAFAHRYHKPFIPISNGVDPAHWPPINKISVNDGVFRLRFIGSISLDLNFTSILRIADAVERIGKGGLKIAFEICDINLLENEFSTQLSQFRFTRIEKINRSHPDCQRWISEADAIAIVYNFDQSRILYPPLGVDTNIPEYFASGSTVFAHGPTGLATIDHLVNTGTSVVVTENSDSAVESELRSLLRSPDRATALANASRDLTFQKHDLRISRKKLVRLLRQATISLEDDGSFSSVHRVPTSSVSNFDPENSTILTAELRAKILRLTSSLLRDGQEKDLVDLKSALRGADSNNPTVKHGLLILRHMEAKSSRISDAVEHGKS